MIIAGKDAIDMIRSLTCDRCKRIAAIIYVVKPAEACAKSQRVCTDCLTKKDKVLWHVG